MKLKCIALLFFLTFSTMQASLDQCRLDAILGAIRTLQSNSSSTLGKVCSILEKVDLCVTSTLDEQILEKVCDILSTISLISTITSLDELVEKVCNIEVTTTLIFDKVCDILNTDTQIFTKVCDIQQTLSLISTPTQLNTILVKVCDIQDTTTEILEKVCTILNTDTQILTKVCDIEVTTTLIFDKVCDILNTDTTILMKVCDIQNTTTETLEKVCTILDTDTQIFSKVCDIEVTTTLIFEKVCTILNTDTTILQKTCDIEVTTTLILDKVCLLLTFTGCDPTPLFNAQTISQPGTYCLANDVSSGGASVFTIAADRVTLDLNGHEISGASDNILVSNQSDIIIKNGIIAGASHAGVDISNTINLLLKDISFAGNDSGTFISTSSCVVIENCNFRECSSQVIELSDVNGGNISNCCLERNQLSLIPIPPFGSAGVFINLINCCCLNLHNIQVCANITTTPPESYRTFNCSDIKFDDCSTTNNSTSGGITMYDIEFCNNIQVINTTFSNNLSTFFDAFFVGSSQNISFDHCVSNNNMSTFGGIGFDFGFSSSFNVLIKNCSVNHNISNGSVVGFGLVNISGGRIDSCNVEGNFVDTTMRGFNFDNCEGIFVDNCLTTSNVGASGDTTAYRLEPTSNNICFQNCLAKLNSNTGAPAVGFDILSGATSIDIQNCIAKDNIGTTSFGFRNSGTGNILLNNKAQGHSTANFSGVGATIVVGFSTTGGGGFTASPGPFDNIDIT